MRWEQAEELRADPAAGPSGRKSVPAGQRRSFWPALAVTAATVAFGSVLWYGYQHGRGLSGSGAPPLIKADQGPVKVKPDRPGGEQIPFQDSTVYDRLGGEGDKPHMEKLLPPPEKPVQLPQQAQAAQAAQQAAPGPAAPTPVPGDAAVLAPRPAAGPTVPTTEVRPLPQQPAPQQAATPQPATQQPVHTASAPARPAGSAALAKEADPIGALAAAALAKPEAPARPAPKSGDAALSRAYRIQLSAVRSEAAIGPEWARLKHHFPETLSSLRMEAPRTDVPGKGTFFRIEAGPLDESRAKAACEHLRARGVGCFVVKPSG